MLAMAAISFSYRFNSIIKNNRIIPTEFNEIIRFSPSCMPFVIYKSRLSAPANFVYYQFFKTTVEIDKWQNRIVT